MTYPDDSIGNRMSVNILTCLPDATYKDIIDKLTAQNLDSIRMAFVVDNENTLLGFIDLAKMSLATSDMKAESLMHKPEVTLRPEEDQERAVFEAINQDEVVLPVVDGDKHLLGAITPKTIINIMHEEHLEDSLLTAGIHGKGSEILKLVSEQAMLSIRSRAPWLLFGLIVGLGLGLLTSFFEKSLQETVALAYFVPVVAYIADSVGTQSEAITVRALAVAKISYGKYLLKELFVGLSLGALVGVIGGLGAVLISGTTRIGIVVGLSLFVASTVAAVVASLVPFIFKAASKDPALGSGPLATAIQDVISVLIYFLFATLLI